MNQVPRAFCERLCDILFSDRIWAAKELSGHYGRFAWTRFLHDCDYDVDVKDGIEQRVYSYLTHTGEDLHTAEEIEAVPKKHVRNVRISLCDAKKESVAESKKIVRRFPYSFYVFGLVSSSINEAWVDLMCSLKQLHSLMITEKLDDDALPLIGKVVADRKISMLSIYAKACEGGNMEVMKSVLSQDQFKQLRIWNIFDNPDSLSTVTDLLQFWSENSEKLRGKSLLLCKFSSVKESGAEQLEQFVLQGASAPKALEKALKVCSKEECDFLNKEYHHNHWMFFKPSCIYKYENAREGVGRRQIYVSFECASLEELRSDLQAPAGHTGHNDLGFLRRATRLRILFA
uniref:F-box domain-containing protein n=1 Tax=Steinernema glaseri TaxID=37863 RepID=A0A1I7XZB8_9BILA